MKGSDQCSPLADPETSLDLTFLSYKVSLQRYWETKMICPQGSVQGCPLVRDGNCVPGWWLLLKLIHTSWRCSQAKANSILILSTQAKFSSQDVCFQRQSLQRCFNYSGRNKCNQHIFSVSFQISRMCENAPQNIFHYEDGTNLMVTFSKCSFISYSYTGKNNHRYNYFSYTAKDFKLLHVLHLTEKTGIIMLTETLIYATIL